MDGSGTASERAAVPQSILRECLLQTVPLDRPSARRPLYWRDLLPTTGTPGPFVDEQGSLSLAPGTAASFDTYFGAVFEYHWRLYTRLQTLTLRLNLQGSARVRVWRRVPHAPDSLLLERHLDGPADIVLPPPPAHFRQAGLVWFDVAAADQTVRLQAACWLTRDSVVAPVELGVAICTFNRADPLAAVLSGIAGHAALQGPLARVIVVNQGEPDLWTTPGIAAAATRLGTRLHPVDQANCGGAGGFGRGLLEAMDDPAISHVCFLDDDVVLEPDCLLRMAAFFALAQQDIAVGGHMLDAVQPTTLYEAGATIRPDWTLQPLQGGLDLENPATLAGLLDTAAVHYNGWWMFGFPKSLVHRMGMPLPCFIRGDDVEFGMRLHRAGLFTVPLPASRSGTSRST